MDAMVREQVGGGEPGVAVAVTQEGVVVHQGCYGLADVEWRQQVTPDTVFALASLTKPFTALAAVLLARDGALDLDAPLTDYLDGYPDPHGLLRLRHLLTHTSGIPNFVTAPGFLDGPQRLDRSPEQFVGLFAHLPLDFAPGTRYGYSNSGYRLLDLIIERAAGAPFGQVLHDRVLAPAGMSRARMLDNARLVDRRARGYERADPDSPDGRSITGDADGWRNADYISATVTGGAGGLGATLEDLIAFDHALRDRLLVDRALEKRLHTPVALADGRTEGYGLGWVLSHYRGTPTVGHAGGIEGFSSYYGRLPEHDTGVIVLSNRGGFDAMGLARRLIDHLLRLPEPAARLATVRHRPERWTGTYTDTVGASAQLVVHEGDLVLLHGGRRRRMVPLDAATYADPRDPGVLLRCHPAGSWLASITVTHPFTWFTGHRRQDGGEQQGSEPVHPAGREYGRGGALPPALGPV
ncbi:serine hydrolase [Streptomyces sp. SID4948]|nr:serine hydrolase [Streptomyces sp. SID4948]